MKRPPYAVLLFSAWATAQLFDGPIRYALVLAGLPSLLYLRDLLLVAALVLVVRAHGFGRPLGAGLVVISAAALAGLVQGRSIGQVVFALKVTLPFVFGVACGGHVSTDVPGPRASRWLGVALLAVAAGVFLNQFVEWPWEGMEYELAGVSGDIKSSKVWSTMGVKRISGFSRSSYDAAVAVAVLSVAVTSRYRRPVFCLAVLTLAAASTYVTTTKGILLNLSIVSATVAASILHPRFGRRALMPSLAALLVAGVVLLPILSLSSKPIFDTSTEDQAFLLSSMNDRFESCWPEAFDLINEQGNLITGRGLGGLGIPQLYFEFERYNPCDNLMIYLIGNYGVFSVLLLPTVAWKVVAAGQADGPFDRFLAMSGLLILSYGMTANVLESPFLSMTVGLILSRPPGPSSDDRPRVGRAGYASPVAARNPSGPRGGPGRPGVPVVRRPGSVPD